MWGWGMGEDWVGSELPGVVAATLALGQPVHSDNREGEAAWVSGTGDVLGVLGKCHQGQSSMLQPRLRFPGSIA